MFVAGLLDSNRQMSDGKLQHSDVGFLIGMVGLKKSTHKELLDAGLWIETSDGVTISGFLDNNKSRVEREAAAKQAHERYERWLADHANATPNAPLTPLPPRLYAPEPDIDTEKQREREAEQAAIAGSVA